MSIFRNQRYYMPLYDFPMNKKDLQIVYKALNSSTSFKKSYDFIKMISKIFKIECNDLLIIQNIQPPSNVVKKYHEIFSNHLMITINFPDFFDLKEDSFLLKYNWLLKRNRRNYRHNKKHAQPSNTYFLTKMLTTYLELNIEKIIMIWCDYYTINCFGIVLNDEEKRMLLEISNGMNDYNGYLSKVIRNVSDITNISQSNITLFFTGLIDFIRFITTHDLNFNDLYDIVSLYIKKILNKPKLEFKEFLNHLDKLNFIPQIRSNAATCLDTFKKYHEKINDKSYNDAEIITFQYESVLSTHSRKWRKSNKYEYIKQMFLRDIQKAKELLERYNLFNEIPDSYYESILENTEKWIIKGIGEDLEEMSIEIRRMVGSGTWIGPPPPYIETFTSKTY